MPLLSEAAATIVPLSPRQARAEAFGVIAPYLSEPLLREALDGALALRYEEMCAQALEGIAPYLSEELLRHALRTIAAHKSRAELLVPLIPYLSEHERPAVIEEVLAAAGTKISGQPEHFW